LLATVHYLLSVKIIQFPLKEKSKLSKLFCYDKKFPLNDAIQVSQKYRLSLKVQSRAIHFGCQYHFKIWLDCHKLKKIPCLIIPMSTKCQKKRQLMSYNMMIGYDIYIASKNDPDYQNLLLATVRHLEMW
jgi:hypothetical protein